MHLLSINSSWKYDPISRGNCSHFQVSWGNSVLKIEKNEDHRHPTFYTMHRFLCGKSLSSFYYHSLN